MSTETIPLIPAADANALYLKSSGKGDRINCILAAISTAIRETAERDRSFIYHRFTHADVDLKRQIIEILEKLEYEVEIPAIGENTVIKIIYG